MQQIKNIKSVILLLVLVSVVLGIIFHFEIQSWYDQSAKFGLNSACAGDLSPAPLSLWHFGDKVENLTGQSFINVWRINWCVDAPSGFYLSKDLFCLLLFITTTVVYWFLVIKWYLASIKNKYVWRIFFIMAAIFFYPFVLGAVYCLSVLLISGRLNNPTSEAL